MGNILHENSGPTLLESIAIDSPEVLSQIMSLYSAKVDISIPEALLEQLISRFNQHLHPQLSPEDIAHRDFIMTKSYTIHIDDLLFAYERLFHVLNKDLLAEKKPIPVKDNYFEHQESKVSGNICDPFYDAHFNIERNVCGSPLSMFNAVINKNELNCYIDNLRLDNVEVVVDARHLSNPEKSTQLVINEFSRDGANINKGNFFVSCNYSSEKQLGKHLWIFPDRPRISFIKLPGRFKNYLKDDGSMQLFEWIESEYGCGQDCACDANESSVDQRCFSMMNDLMNKSESACHKATIEKIVRRMETMYVTGDMTREIELRYENQLHGTRIIKSNIVLKARTRGLTEELNIKKLKTLVETEYENYGHKVDLRLPPGEKFIFSVFYDHAKMRNSNSGKDNFTVFQLYAHRPSSVTGEDKFESFLDIANSENPRNRFVLKIDELKRYNGKGLYAIELFNYGKKFEYHFQVLEAESERIITLPEWIRSNMPQNDSLPEYIQIHNRIKNS